MGNNNRAVVQCFYKSVFKITGGKLSYVDVLSHNTATVSRGTRRVARGTRQELSLRWKVLMLKVLRLREPHFLFTPDVGALEPTLGGG